MTFDDELSEAARGLHSEWESPDLWPAISGGMREIERAEGNARVRRGRWQAFAAAAALLLAVGAAVIVVRELTQRRVERAAPVVADVQDGRLLSDEALVEVERAELQYIAAIEALAGKAAAARSGASADASPLLAHLRERLLVIDAAIVDCRAEIERNRFNAHLRRQLLAMYQEKRRTLEEILEQERHAS